MFSDTSIRKIRPKRLIFRYYTWLINDSRSKINEQVIKKENGSIVIFLFDFRQLSGYIMDTPPGKL